MKVKWLNRSLLVGPYLTLCTSEDEYRSVLKKVGCTDGGEWLLKSESWATTHILSDGNDLTCVVCVSPGDHSEAALAGVMAHEAVHIWRAFLDSIGEDDPGEEVEAYAIQNIAFYLTDELLSRR